MNTYGLEITGEVTNEGKETIYDFRPKVTVNLKDEDGNYSVYSVNRGELAERLVEVTSSDVPGMRYTESKGKRDYIESGETLFYVVRSDPTPKGVDGAKASLEFETY